MIEEVPASPDAGLERLHSKLDEVWTRYGQVGAERALDFAPMLTHLRERGEINLAHGLALFHSEGGGAFVIQPPVKPGGITEIDHVTDGLQVMVGLRVV